MASPGAQELRSLREHTLYRLLLRGYRAENAEVLAELYARGHVDMQPSYPKLLANLDTEGTTISALAAKAGITRQAAGQQLKEIAERGFVKLVPDRTDRRATLVRFTPKGRRMHADAVEITLARETHYARVLGRRRFQTLLKDLGELVDAIDPIGRLGPN